jgi:hypothetical protein
MEREAVETALRTNINLTWELKNCIYEVSLLFLWAYTNSIPESTNWER